MGEAILTVSRAEIELLFRHRSDAGALQRLKHGRGRRLSLDGHCPAAAGRKKAMPKRNSRRQMRRKPASRTKGGKKKTIVSLPQKIVLVSANNFSKE